MQNDPGSSIYNPVSREALLAAIVPIKLLPKNLHITFHLDTAFKKIETQAKGDESAIIKLGHQLGTGKVYYLGGWGSNLWSMEDFLTKLVGVVKESQKRGEFIRGITDELEPGGKVGAWEYAMRSAFHQRGVRMPPFFGLSRSFKRKTVRMIEAAGYIAEQLAFFVDGSPGLEALFDQMSKIGQSEYDDRMDAYSDGFHPKVYLPPNQKGVVVVQPEEARFAGDDFLKRAVQQSIEEAYGDRGIVDRDELESI